MGLLVVLLWPAAGWAQTPPPQAPGPGGEIVEYYATDALGSIRVVFTAAGAEVARADYLPFGERFHTTGPLPPQQFTGQQRDPEAQLDHFNARSYQTNTGRFTGIDPVYAGLFDPQQWNRYAYARGNPLKYVDPTGLMADSGIKCQDILIDGVPHAVCSDSITVNPGGGGGGGGGGIPGRYYPDPPPITGGDGSDEPTGGGGIGSGWNGGPLVPNPLTDVLTQAAPVVEGLGNGAAVGVLGATGSAAATRAGGWSALWNATLGWIAAKLRPLHLEFTPKVFDQMAKGDYHRRFPQYIESAVVKYGDVFVGNGGYIEYRILGSQNGVVGWYQIGGQLSPYTRSLSVNHYYFSPLR